MLLFHHLRAFPFLALAATSCRAEILAPTVTVNNGTIQGTYNNEYRQDLFLGIPYAQPPVGELRFSRPRPMNITWEQPYLADNYSPFCYGNTLNLPGFSQSSIVYPESEDCLTINIVRPSNCSNSSPLPVLIWIHGGGFQEGGSGDSRYNMSSLVNTSAEIGKPIIGVSINYRLGAFGFISGQPFRHQKRTNLGLHDQRLALLWVQENIGSFGGDPLRVTIQGESAGAYSVGLHLLANNGSDEGLFHQAIAESGSLVPFAPVASDETQDSMLENLKATVGCSSVDNVVGCLQSIPASQIRNASAALTWNPIIDGDLISNLPSVSLRNGVFNRVPLLIGATTNEGTPFVPLFSTVGAETVEDFKNTLVGFFGQNISTDIQDSFQRLYLERDEQAELLELGTVLRNPGAPYGSLYGSMSLLVGDLVIIAGRRITAEAWARFGVDCYSYRFDTVPAGMSPQILGAAHFQEVAFVFRNTKGYGYETNPFEISDLRILEAYYDLAEEMSRMWISFVHTGSPNNHGIANVTHPWPKYTLNNPQNIVFNATGEPSRLEKDTVRADSMRFIGNMSDLLHR